MIKNIIFDLGNVIIQNPTLNTVKEFFAEENDASVFYRYIFKSEFWKMMDLGKITNLEIADTIKEQKLVNVKNYDEIKNFMLNWFSKCIINTDTIELGKRLKKKAVIEFIFYQIWQKKLLNTFQVNMNFLIC